MTSACSSRDSFPGRGSRPRLGLLIWAMLAPGVALAQQLPDSVPAPLDPASPTAAAPAPDEIEAPVQGPPVPAAVAVDVDETDYKAAKQSQPAKQGKPVKQDKTPKQNKHKGRVLALAELSHRRETVVSLDGGLENRKRDALDFSLQSARVGVEYRSPLRWLSAEVELELAKNVRPKDAYIQAGRTFYVKAGQFKIPSAALELASHGRCRLHGAASYTT